VDAVGLRIVIGIDRRRAHIPLLLVRGSSYLGQHTVAFEGCSTSRIAHCVAARDGQAGVVTPVGGISDLVGDRVELLFGLRFCRGTHPFELLNIAPHRGFDIAHDGGGARLVLRAELPRYIDAAQRLTKRAIYRPYAALPAHQLFRLAAQYFAVESELLIVE